MADDYPETTETDAASSDERKEVQSKESREEFLATARKRFEDSASDEESIRDQAKLDLRFVAGEQWDKANRSRRQAKGRPALTFNRCHTFVQQVSNEARQNKPQIKFIAAEDNDKDTAEIYEGLARQIQYCSDAQIAYETAVEYSAGGSIGYYRLLTDYCDDEGWDQEIKISPVFDPFAVYGVLIPSCFGLEPQYAFVVEDIPADEYKRLYDTEEIDRVGWAYAERMSQGWVGTDTVRVAEYWFIEHEKKTIKRKGDDGREQTREISIPHVKFCKINGLEVIKGSETDWPGYCIPIIPVLGKQIIVDGKPNLFSVVRFQRDPQQLINYYKTRIAETLGTAPISPFIVVEGQIQGHEKEWIELNDTLRPYLTVRPIDVNGNPAPMPERQTFEPPIAALSNAAAEEIDDMKATAGIFDASLGNRGNETSGKGILARQQQSNVTNMHFMDNLERSFKKGGELLADLIPKVYDTPRMIRILGEDEAPKIIKINQAHQDAKGETKHYKLGGEGVGKYDIVVTMGRAYSTKRMESFDMMGQLVQGNPQLLPMIGDILFRNSDMAGADQLADRFKKMLPPNLQADDGTAEAKLAQTQSQLQQIGQQHQQLMAALQEAQQKLNAKQVETDARKEIELFKAQKEYELEILKLQTQRDIAEISTKSQDARERMKLDASLDETMHVSAHEAGMQAQEQAHQKALADQQAATQSALSAQGAAQTQQQQAAADPQAQ